MGYRPVNLGEIHAIHKRLDGLEYDVELIKAELNIEDTEERRREKAHHHERLNAIRQGNEPNELSKPATIIIVGFMTLGLVLVFG